nr:hypothetical protein TetV2_00104 [Oceanusvirus sp.]
MGQGNSTLGEETSVFNNIDDNLKEVGGDLSALKKRMNMLNESLEECEKEKSAVMQQLEAQTAPSIGSTPSSKPAEPEPARAPEPKEEPKEEEEEEEEEEEKDQATQTQTQPQQTQPQTQTTGGGGFSAYGNDYSDAREMMQEGGGKKDTAAKQAAAIAGLAFVVLASFLQ